MTSQYLPGKEHFEALRRQHNVVPVWTEVIADLETPVSTYMKLVQGADPDSVSFLLESVEHGQRWGRYSFVGVDPFLVVTSHDGKVEIQGSLLGDIPQASPLEVVRRILDSFSVPVMPELPPLIAGGVGFLGYDVVRYLERLPQTTVADVKTPELLLIFARTLFVFDHLRQRLTVVSNVVGDDSYEEAIERTRGLVAKLGEPLAYEPQGVVPAEFDLPPSTLGRRGYMDAVERAKEYIRAGDIFQVVPSHRFSAPQPKDPFAVYRALRLVNPSPYMFFLKHPEITLVGSSPEPLIKVQGRRVIQRPIAGTRPRGATDEEDQALEKDLLADEKERAEHVMLVDLARNDLGRVCTFGTVEVEEFMVIERYSHVMHMTSQVAGELREDKTGLDALYASFPAGTVSGAPKIRAMEIIDELEPTRRGPYSGVVGYFDFSGNLDTCIALRTAYVTGGNIYIQAGGGIVADSDPMTEWLETVNKAKALLTAWAIARNS
ncbi:MAG TPA: anthranilate synthase component I [Actinomycetota bacterium]|nr:anthranilate synthase component I [Actinomycetota bacterium]